MVTKKERNEIFNLIRSSDDQNKKLGIDLARSLKLESKDILEMILATGWTKRNVYQTWFQQNILFLNLSFEIVCYCFFSSHSDSKKEVQYNCLGKNEIFIQQTIQLLIANIKTI
jgi:hypothetical protein